MATHKSAEKRHRQNKKLNARNKFAKSTYRTSIKDTLALEAEGKVEEAKEKAKLATKLLDKAAIHGIIHKKNAQRRISRLNSKIVAKN